MPSLGQHMARARQIAADLDHPAIEADRGAYYLGATAPDIRVITKRDRWLTHFFDLDEMGRQDSVARMLQEHPGLCDASDLDARTRAFLAGYVTHLVLDEVYIETMYRKFFGKNSPKADHALGDVLDRALQFEMNRRELEDGSALSEIIESLEMCSTSNEVAFIEDEYLEQWREVILDFARQGPTWDRFPRMMNVHLKRAGFSDEEIERYSVDGPALAQESLDYVSEERVERFVDEATRAAADRVRRYLGESE